MARTLIGNFKGPEGPRGERGPQGEQGPRGEQGVQGESVDNNMMGSENLFSMSREKWRYSGNIAEYDYRNGVIRFSNTIYQFRYEIYLREGNYTVNVDDVINPERSGYENTVTLGLHDSNEDSIRTIGVLGGTESEHPSTRSFNITESEAIENDGVFHIQVSIANEGRHTGEIRGLQIVRGEVCPTWALSTEDSLVGNSQSNEKLFFETMTNVDPDGDNETDYRFFNLKGDNFSTGNNSFKLPGGLWSFDWVFSLASFPEGDTGFVRVKVNGEPVIRQLYRIGGGHCISTTLLLEDDDEVSLSFQNRNGSNITVDGSQGYNNRLTMVRGG